MAKTAATPVNLSMPSVTTNEMADVIYEVFMAGWNQEKGKRKYLPIHFTGMPGIGKTAGFVQASMKIADKLGRRWVHQPTSYDYSNYPVDSTFFVNDVRISQMSSLDVRGLVARSEHNRDRMTWLAPEWLPTGENTVAMNFFDEIQLGRPEVQAAAYQIINERMVGNVRLAEDVMQIAASNPIRAGGLNYGIPPALANRFSHMEVVADAESFLEWGSFNGIHPFVRSFINFQQADLLVFPDNPDQLSYPTPRTWEMVSNMIGIGTEVVRNKLINAAIGAEHAAKFVAYLTETLELPDPRTVLVEGKMHYPKRRDLLYAMLESLLSAVQEDQTHIKNFIEWTAGNEVSADLQAYGFKMAMNMGKVWIIRSKPFIGMIHKNPRLSELIVNAR